MSSPRVLRMMGGAAWMGLVVGFVACGDGFSVGPTGETVGGSCGENADCDVDSTCLDGGDFPGGTCTVSCSSHADCPDGTRCISKSGGVCLLECESRDDCRGGYECEDESEEGSSAGKALVCIN